MRIGISPDGQHLGRGFSTADISVEQLVEAASTVDGVSRVITRTTQETGADIATVQPPLDPMRAAEIGAALVSELLSAPNADPHNTVFMGLMPPTPDNASLIAQGSIPRF